MLGWEGLQHGSGKAPDADPGGGVGEHDAAGLGPAEQAPQRDQHGLPVAAAQVGGHGEHLDTADLAEMGVFARPREQRRVYGGDVVGDRLLGPGSHAAAAAAQGQGPLFDVSGDVGSEISESGLQPRGEGRHAVVQQDAEAGENVGGAAQGRRSCAQGVRVVGVADLFADAVLGQQHDQIAVQGGQDGVAPAVGLREAPGERQRLAQGRVLRRGLAAQVEAAEPVAARQPSSIASCVASGLRCASPATAAAAVSVCGRCRCWRRRLVITSRRRKVIPAKNSW